MSEENREEKEREEQEAKQTIDDFGVIRNVFQFDSDIQYLTIIGSIEGHMTLPPQNKTTKYENIIPQLVAVEENPKVKGLLVILNTVGGDVEAGLALAEMIATLSKPTVSLVLGGGHSIGGVVGRDCHVGKTKSLSTCFYGAHRRCGCWCVCAPVVGICKTCFRCYFFIGS